MTWLLHRPPGFHGALDDHLPRIHDGLVRSLAAAQKKFSRDTLKLPRPALESLAGVLVEFAEDVHAGLGIWRSLERSNQELFGTPLPFFLEPGDHVPPEVISLARVQYLLWVLYPQIATDLMVLSPEHVDLVRLAEVVAEGLQERFADLPADSGVKQFLGTPNRYGWEVKRKLVWLGTRSYLLRDAFHHYAEEQEEAPSDINTMDDFICQECTQWSGLGALDLLAGVLDLPPERRADLLAWSERHNALFRIGSSTARRMEVRNLISGGTYRVRMSPGAKAFRKGSYVHGSLIPWDGEWYWSGAQTAFRDLGADEIERLKDGYRKLPAIFYRYSPEALRKARAMVRKQYDEFVGHHGRDWVGYPDGLAMAADWRRAAKAKFEALPPAEREAFLKRHGLKEYSPDFKLPPDLLKAKDGIGVYFNPEEGMEICVAFDALLSGLEKGGTGLAPAEAEAIPGWIMSDSISPGFVRRLAERYGEESIKAAFLLGKHREGYALEYLLRRYKGRFYRPRYPTLTIVD
jgi:Protein of unknown function (DUF3843)